jgi:hypothetical protein
MLSTPSKSAKPLSAHDWLRRYASDAALALCREMTLSAIK